MFRTLLWKEWRQLRGLTLFGAGFGLALPLVLLVFAVDEEAAGTAGRYSSRDVFESLVPALVVVGLLPLWTLMAGVQAFSGDAVLGTSRFLSDRPVRRTSLWLAQLCAATLSVLVVAGVAFAGWFVLGRALSDARLLVTLAGLIEGDVTPLILIAFALGFCSAILAASFGARSFTGVLLGASIAGLAAGALLVIAVSSGFSRNPSLALACIGGVLFALFQLLASWVMICRGEPAGRGRIARGLGTIGGAVVAMAIAAVVLQPLVFRSAAWPVLLPNWLFPQQSVGASAFFLEARSRFGGLWVFDRESQERLRFLDTATLGAYDDEGGRLAVATFDASLWWSPRSRIEVLDANARRTGDTVDLGGDRWVSSVFWIGEEIIVRMGHTLYAARPASGELETLAELPPGRHRLCRPASGDRLLLASRSESRDGRDAVPTVELREIDTKSGAISKEAIAAYASPFVLPDPHLSQSGRLLVTSSLDADAPADVVDLESGVRHPLDEPVYLRSAAWLPDDGLVFVPGPRASSGNAPERRHLMLWRAEEGARELLAFESGDEVWLTTEKGGRRVLVVRTRLEDGFQDPYAIGIYDPGTNRLSELALPAGVTLGRSASWLSPGLIGITTAAGETLAVDIDDPDAEPRAL